VIRVLVVDDDFMVARIHRGFVESVPGFTVVDVTSTGSEAVAAVRSTRPDLVLLDIHLPDVNGLTLLPRLREAHPDLDAIVISAAREAETVRQALRGGIVHYLLKPFSRDDLRDSLLHYEQSYRGLDAEDTAEQQDVNRVFRRPAGPVADARLPKKLSPETADLIEQALRAAGGDLSASECAEVVGLARVSVRRYLEHFVTVGQAEVHLRYGGVGRPERRYAWRP
jgi:response regulator of citrate/malate metabolism